MEAEKRTQFNALTSVQFLRGVGPHRAKVFAQIGVATALDLLEYYPRNHVFRPPVTLSNELVAGMNATVAGKVKSIKFNPRSRPPKLDITLMDPAGSCKLVWFHGAYIKDKIQSGDNLIAWGKVNKYRKITQIVNPKWTKIQDIEELFDGDEYAESIYPATADLSSAIICRTIRQSLEKLLPLTKERFTDNFLSKRNLPTRRQALSWYHKPASTEQIDSARRRLAYDELFLMELAIGLRRETLAHTQAAIPMQINEKLDKRIRRLFPFDLTDSQKKVISEICDDMSASEPMNRLLQGDVGSGKTVVALYAALLAIGHKQQVAIMAPTEILAQQHFESIEKYLAHSRVKRALVKGGITGKKRKELLSQIASGEIDIVVGTQALVQKDIAFKNLALVVIDEQHKFGVRQREIIRSKDLAPHYLVMTATPIPRTLAMTVFGDLEVSTIDHLPPGRKEIKTRWVHKDTTKKAYEFIGQQISLGRQAYFVYPRVEESEISEDEKENINPAKILKAAVAEHKKLQKMFSDFTVALLHGKMDQQTKQQTMADFRNHKIDILVTTVVIEVGVNVPNATIMVIEHADRFGLAQLHQLRGRIGRGDKQSYCLLFGDGFTDQAKHRLSTMTKTSDGFRIAEEDLKLRGPGEFFGTAQHGLPELRVANLIEDFELLRMAQRDAFEMASADPHLIDPDNQELKRQLKKQFGTNITLIDVS